MKKYSISYRITEADLQPRLQDGSLWHDFDTLEEAEAAFHKELDETTLKKVSDLDFTPSDEECREYMTNLDLELIDLDLEPDDADYVECIITSPNLWIDR